MTNNNTYIQQMTVNTKNAQEAGIVVATTGRMGANSTRPKTAPRGATSAFDSTDASRYSLGARSPNVDYGS